MVCEGVKEYWSSVWRRKHWSNGFGFTSCSWWWKTCHRVWPFISFPQSFHFYEIVNHNSLLCLIMLVSLSIHTVYLSCYCLLQSYSQDTHAKRGMWEKLIVFFLIISRFSSLIYLYPFIIQKCQTLILHIFFIIHFFHWYYILIIYTYFLVLYFKLSFLLISQFCC